MWHNGKKCVQIQKFYSISRDLCGKAEKKGDIFHTIEGISNNFNSMNHTVLRGPMI